MNSSGNAKASGNTGARLVADLPNDMVRNSVIPSDCKC